MSNDREVDKSGDFLLCPTKILSFRFGSIFKIIWAKVSLLVSLTAKILDAIVFALAHQ